MVRKLGFLLVCAMLLLVCFPMPGHAEENQCLNAATAQGSAQGPVQAGNPPSAGKMTLEELKNLVGAQNVCGAQCGLGFPKCWYSCGEVAQCLWGYCVYSLR